MRHTGWVKGNETIWGYHKKYRILRLYVTFCVVESFFESYLSKNRFFCKTCVLLSTDSTSVASNMIITVLVLLIFVVYKTEMITVIQQNWWLRKMKSSFLFFQRWRIIHDSHSLPYLNHTCIRFNPSLLTLRTLSAYKITGLNIDFDNIHVLSIFVWNGN